MPSPRTTPRSRPTRDETREVVLGAASAVFSERGYTLATVPEIAAACGMTKGAVYSGFGGKDDLFFEVLRRRTSERLTAATQQRGPGGFSGGDIGRVLEAFTADDPTWHLAVIQFWATVTTSSDDALRSKFAALRRELRADIARALELAGVAPDRATWMSVAILALSNGLAIERSIDRQGVDGVFSTALAAWFEPSAPL